MKVGLVGFAGSGKTTIYSAMTGQQVETGYAGKSSKPHLGTVKVPDERIDELVRIYTPRKVTFAEIVFVDFANVSHPTDRSLDSGGIAAYREVDALAHVVRCFSTMDGKEPSPLRDITDFQTEIVLADLVPVEKRLERLKKEKPQPGEVELLTEIKNHLEAGLPLRSLLLSEQQLQKIAGYRFLTLKPEIIVLNVAENDLHKPLPSDLDVFLKKQALASVVMSGPIEMDIAKMPKEEQGLFLSELGIKESALIRFIQTTYRALDLISFLTAGEDECRAWTIRCGTTAHRAAGKIHSDIERGFIRAEVMSFTDFSAIRSEAKMRELGKLRLEGKDYVVKDGDIVHFRHAT